MVQVAHRWNIGKRFSSGNRQERLRFRFSSGHHTYGILVSFWKSWKYADGVILFEVHRVRELEKLTFAHFLQPS
jgi:hypothetical protein